MTAKDLPEHHATREIFDLLTGAWRGQAVYVAVRLKLLDHVQAGHRSDADLAGATGVDPDHIVRFMRLLVALGLVESVPGHGYRPTAPGALLIADAPGSLHELCLMHGEELHSSWTHAYEAVSDPTATGFGLAYGQEVYDYYRENKAAATRFQRALRASNAVVSDAVATALDFSGRRIVDVGGGNGALLAAILRAVPGTTGLLIDQPNMVHVATAELGEFIPHRAEARAGDMFESIPPDGDVYLLSRVLGDWDADDCATILTNCRKAMRRSARLVVIERLIGHRPHTVLPELWDIHLMVLVQGRQRTTAEVNELAARTGFRIDESIDLPLETTALVLSPDGD